ncbi:MAG: N-acetylneuraminate lyase, partial [Clostridia bacterium]|nr:N-acetylneuraminate lyase [Clostridia bacterium]
MKDFKGIYAALLTPFNKDGSINFDSLKLLVERNIEVGLTGMYVCGSTGESVLMSEEERISILKFVAEVNAGRSILIAHVGTISTDSACRMAKKAEEFGYDAVSAVVPFYFSFSSEAIKGYYKDILNASNLPMIIYNFPGANGFGGMLELVNEMIDNPKLIGVKHTSANLFDLERFKNLSKPLVVYNGFDEMLIGGLSMGADGGIGSTYNFMGSLILDIYNAFNAGDITLAQKYQTKANRIIDKMIPYGVFAME